ncbi:MAG: hypothetical protein JW846_09495 [Dehalococcoidia bacterium]|nr:hypothetical protein [Dehalococcoidia bacterium]
MRTDGSDWKRIGESKFESEYILQQLLYETPEVIPVASWGAANLQPKVFVREAGLPGSGNTDLIGVDEQGGISIIECKLARNPEVRRKVVGQLLEYAAYLWQMTYESFDDVCCRAEKWNGLHLADLMAKNVRESEEWSEEQFRAGVEANLKQGTFTLIIAVDLLNDELKRIIEYLDSRGSGAPTVAVLQMRQFQEGDTQLLVPQVFGASPAVSRRESSPRTPLDEGRFLELCGDQFPEARLLYSKAKALSQERQSSGAADSLHWSSTSYSYRISWPGNQRGTGIFIGWYNSSVSLGMAILDAAPEAGTRYWELVKPIPTFSGRIANYKEPFAQLQGMTEKEMDQFIDAIRQLSIDLASSRAVDDDES